ncbi:uridine kinase [Solitalea sp. MAHUQ-68]|uniref:Uridine kinase n=1 Tax=Solitalea agri TaxID=2953739 RepID=A0A9X2F5Z6_9SPHI|nr:uridine kinase [Solitalea agri]MCO4294784.1 uridine kinase [Solitalea agri]
MTSKPFVIGVAGGSGSGKTYFLRSILNYFDPQDVCIVSQDDYYIPVGNLSPEENKLYNFDLPRTIDNEKFQEDVFKLISGESVFKKEYTFNNPNAIPKMLECKPAPIIVIEGLFIFHFEGINNLLDMRIFIDAHEELALKRRLKRDQEERGYSHEDIMYKWENHVVPAYNEFLLPHKENADLVVENNEVQELDFIGFRRAVEERRIKKNM